MRILILCVATFGAGILAGFLVGPDEPIQRNDSRESVRGDRGYRDREGAWEIESGDGDAASSADAQSSTGSSANVRALTARANKALERLESGELAAVLDEADGSLPVLEDDYAMVAEDPAPYGDSAHSRDKLDSFISDYNGMYGTSYSTKDK